jgi:hypothetical protein
MTTTTADGRLAAGTRLALMGADGNIVDTFDVADFDLAQPLAAMQLGLDIMEAAQR